MSEFCDRKGKHKMKISNMASPGLEPETFSVLDWRDNQLHHDTFLILILLFGKLNWLELERPWLMAMACHF